MWVDPIIEEIHQIRAEHAAQYDYDLATIVKNLQQQELQSDKKFVSFPPRLLANDEDNGLNIAELSQKVTELRSELTE
ncbi:MAG: hypothetical protein ACE5I1_13500 [bacterium]